MKKILALLLVSVMCFSVTGCKKSDTDIRFGVAAVGGMYYSFGTTFSQLANDGLDGYTFNTKTTAGSAANIRLLSEGYLELAISQADLIEDAINGTGIFEGKKYDNYTRIASLYTEACQIIVKADSDINSVDDLLNATVGIGEEESGTQKNAIDILTVSGLYPKLTDTVYCDYTTAVSMLKSGKIDAFFCTAGIKTTVIDELSKDIDIRLIGLDTSVVDKLTSSYECYDVYTIPAGTYKGQDKDVTTIGIKAVLLAGSRLPESFSEQVLKFLEDNYDSLQYSLSADIQIEKIN